MIDFWENLTKAKQHGLDGWQSVAACLGIEIIHAAKTWTPRDAKLLNEAKLPSMSMTQMFKSEDNDDDFQLMFGKHIGKTLKEVPTSYLLYVAKTSKDKGIADRCNRVLKKRPDAASLLS